MRATTTAAIAAVLLVAGIASAGHVEPAKAKKFRFELVNSFLPCDSANTMTESGSLDSACTPPSPWNTCALGSSGSGKFTAVKTGSVAGGNQDIKFTVKAKGLNAACENRTLCIYWAYRATTDDCPEGSCTVVDHPEWTGHFNPPGGCCLVTNGVCKIATTLSASFPLRFTSGRKSGIELHGCGLFDALPPLYNPVAACGMLFD